MSDAAELIGRIKVQGAETYKAAMDAMGRETETLSSRLKQVGQNMMQHLVNPMNLLTGGLVGGALIRGIRNLTGDFIGFGHEAIEQSAKIERLKMTYAALAGSMDVAGNKMRYLQQFSAGAITHFDDLAQAGTLLEASGLSMERYIPIVDTLAGVFGGASDQVLELARAIGRMASSDGQMGETMEVLRRFGISAKDLGVNFKPGQAMTASTTDMLNSLETAVRRKFGSFGSIMKDSMAVRLSSLQDAWNQLLQRFGDGLAPFARKAIDKLMPIMNFLRDSNVFQNFAGNMGKAINNIFGMMGQGAGGFTRVVSYLIAGFEKLPTVLSSVASWSKRVFQAIMDGAVTAANWMQRTFVGAVNGIGRAIGNFLTNLKRGMADIWQSLAGVVGKMPGQGGVAEAMNEQAIRMRGKVKFDEMKAEPFKNFGDMMSRAFNATMGGSPFGKSLDGVGKRADAVYKQLEAYMKKGPGVTPDGSQFPMFNGSHMDEIAQNTRQTANNTAQMRDLKKYALGGGDLGQMGVTPAELGKRQSSATARTVNVRITGGANKKLAELLQDIVEEAFLERDRFAHIGLGTH